MDTIRAYRKAKSLTLEGLAERLGVHTSMVFRMETGHKAGFALVRRVADEIGIDLETALLLYGSDRARSDYQLISRSIARDAQCGHGATKDLDSE